MLHSRFFEQRGPFSFEDIIRTIGCTEDFSSFKSLEVYGIDSLINAKKNEITFLSSNKYTNISYKTKAAACITSLNLSKFLPESCIKGDCQNGYGAFVLTDLEYTGEFKSGKANGQGTLTYKDGSKYVGKFIKGKFNGQGTHTKTDGEKYEGEFVQGL